MNILSKMFILPISTIYDLNIDNIKNVNVETETGQTIRPGQSFNGRRCEQAKDADCKNIKAYNINCKG